MTVAALLACTLAAAIKLPRAVRGEGRVSFFGLVFLAVGLLLAIPEVYMTVDGRLGGHNLTNLIIRVMVQLVGVAVAVSLARVFSAYRVESFVLSLPGYMAVAVSIALMGAMLAPMGAWAYSSPGMSAFSGDPWLLSYALVGTLYPSILAAALLPPVLRFVFASKGAVVPRIAYLLIVIGMIALVLVSVVQLLALLGVLELGGLAPALASLSPVGFGAGMLMLSVWSLGVRLRVAQVKQPTATA
jgi:hypothetical protein